MPTDRSEYFKKWREENAEKVKIYRETTTYTKLKCPFCEKMISRGNMNRHIKQIHT